MKVEKVPIDTPVPCNTVITLSPQETKTFIQAIERGGGSVLLEDIRRALLKP